MTARMAVVWYEDMQLPISFRDTARGVLGRAVSCLIEENYPAHCIKAA